MCKFKDLTNDLGYTYLDRFFEKLAFRLSENINKDVSAMRTLDELADEIAFTDDGYLYCIIENDFHLDVTEDMKFRIEHIKKSNSYVLLVNDKLYSAFDSLSSVLKSCIEDYFNE